MFGFGKKKRPAEIPIPEKKTLTSEVFGEITFQYFWTGRAETSVFGTLQQAELWIFTEDEFTPDIDKAQEDAYREFRERRAELEAAAETVLREYYGLSDDFDLWGRFSANAVIVHRDAQVALLINDYDEPEGMNSREVVVTVLPQAEYFGSVDDYC